MLRVRHVGTPSLGVKLNQGLTYFAGAGPEFSASGKIKSSHQDSNELFYKTLHRVTLLQTVKYTTAI